MSTQVFMDLIYSIYVLIIVLNPFHFHPQLFAQNVAFFMKLALIQV